MSRNYQQHGFSLLELLLAMGVLVVVALAVVGVGSALSGGIAENQDYYQCLQGGRITLLRLEDMIRRSLLVADGDDHVIWIWREDTNQDSKMNLSETSLIFWEPGPGELVEYRIEFPESWSDRKRRQNDREIRSWLYGSADLVYWFYFERSSYAARRVLVDGVSDFGVHTTPNAPYGELVTINVTLSRGNRTLTLRSAVKLRDNWGEYVEWDDDRWTIVRYEDS